MVILLMYDHPDLGGRYQLFGILRSKDLIPLRVSIVIQDLLRDLPGYWRTVLYYYIHNRKSIISTREAIKQVISDLIQYWLILNTFLPKFLGRSESVVCRCIFQATKVLPGPRHTHPAFVLSAPAMAMKKKR